MLKKIGLGLLGLVVLLTIIFFLGPRVDVDQSIRPIKLPVVGQLDAHLKNTEGRFKGLKPGTEKKIHWADPKNKTQTPISVVYFHGFSASRQESAPLSDMLAKSLNANLFYTRLTGHGLKGDALGKVSVNSWLNDAVEGVKVAEAIGKKVVVVGLSTGGTVAMWLATYYKPKSVAAYVLLSPNISPKKKGAQRLLWPWGEQLANVFLGTHRQWKPVNKRHAQYWTSRYPTRALVVLMGLCSLIDKPDNPGKMTTPALFLYSPDDNTISTEKIKKYYKKVATKTKALIPITKQDGRGHHHVLAGAILSPKSTTIVHDKIMGFLKPILPSIAAPVAKRKAAPKDRQ